MNAFLRSRRGAWMLVLIQLTLLVVLATLQFRWTGELSYAERIRLETNLESSGRRFAEDFQRELTRALLHFLPLPPHTVSRPAVGSYAQRLARWRQTAPYPGLIAGLEQITRDGDDRLELQRLDETTSRFEPTSWPSELADLRRRLEQELPFDGHRPRGRALLLAEVPAFVLPNLDRPPGGGRRPSRSFHGHDGLLLLRLDPTFLRQELLPLLGRRYFGIDHGDYHIAVRLAGGDGRLIYRSDPQLPPEHFLAADLAIPLFGTLRHDEIRRLFFDLRLHETFDGPDLPPEIDRPPFDHHPPLPWRALAGDPEDGGWALLVRHPEGSLESAVSRARRRNLAVSLAVLALLGVTVAVLAVASRRAQRLARQQVEFVAGVSHELRTPLAAIDSLSQNLADGIIDQPDRVRHYGETIKRQGSRLRKMVDQVLELSGMLAGKRSVNLERIDPAIVVQGAVADCAALFDGKVETRFAEDLPAIDADADALRRAVGNLLTNALKYGDGGARAEMEVHTTSRQAEGELAIRVIDRGPGIPREDLPHLFEPFYRGRDAREAQIQGSGLGLALVRHVAASHGGRVEVDSEPGRGSTFTIYLPVPQE